jgi:hypothetical protein
MSGGCIVGGCVVVLPRLRVRIDLISRLLEDHLIRRARHAIEQTHANARLQLPLLSSRNLVLFDVHRDPVESRAVFEVLVDLVAHSVVNSAHEQKSFPALARGTTLAIHYLGSGNEHALVLLVPHAVLLQELRGVDGVSERAEDAPKNVVRKASFPEGFSLES